VEAAFARNRHHAISRRPNGTGKTLCLGALNFLSPPAIRSVRPPGDFRRRQNPCQEHSTQRHPRFPSLQSIFRPPKLKSPVMKAACNFPLPVEESAPDGRPADSEGLRRARLVPIKSEIVKTKSDDTGAPPAQLNFLPRRFRSVAPARRASRPACSGSEMSLFIAAYSSHDAPSAPRPTLT